MARIWKYFLVVITVFLVYLSPFLFGALLAWIIVSFVDVNYWLAFFILSFGSYAIIEIFDIIQMIRPVRCLSCKRKIKTSRPLKCEECGGPAKLSSKKYPK